MNGPTGSEKVVYTTVCMPSLFDYHPLHAPTFSKFACTVFCTVQCAGAFFGAAIGSVESVWAIPKLGAKLPKLSTQLKHLGTRSVHDIAENENLNSDLHCGAFMQFVFAAVGCIFSTGEYLSASIRQTEDPINAGVGGALVGIVPGIVKQSMRVGVGAGVAAGAAMCAASFWYVAMKQAGWYIDDSIDVGLCVLSRQSSQETSFAKYGAAYHADRS